MANPKISYAENEEWEAVARTVWRLNPSMHWAHKGGWPDVVREMKQTGAESARKGTVVVGTGGWEVSIHKIKGGFYLRPGIAVHLVESCARRS